MGIRGSVANYGGPDGRPRGGARAATFPTYQSRRPCQNKLLPYRSGSLGAARCPWATSREASTSWSLLQPGEIPRTAEPRLLPCNCPSTVRCLLGSAAGEDAVDSSLRLDPAL